MRFSSLSTPQEGNRALCFLSCAFSSADGRNCSGTPIPSAPWVRLHYSGDITWKLPSCSPLWLLRLGKQKVEEGCPAWGFSWVHEFGPASNTWSLYQRAGSLTIQLSHWVGSGRSVPWAGPGPRTDRQGGWRRGDESVVLLYFMAPAVQPLPGCMQAHFLAWSRESGFS